MGFVLHSLCRMGRFTLPAAICFLGASPGHSHPLQAEPINHAYVFTFDQFNLNEDPDEHLVHGGLLLLAELNCVACHKAPEGWREQLSPKPGPDLSGVGSRLDADTIWLMVRSPQHRKKGTQMPGLFAGEEGDAEKVEAITEYLASLKKPAPPMPKGDVKRGRQLYHTVGCVACHEPAAESDYRPPRVPKDVDLERPGNGSVPIALADAYEPDALASFLFDPLAMRPSGRMPSMRLSREEAADVAAYLHMGRMAEKAMERAVLKIPPQGVERGRELFAAQRCTSCHATGEEELPVRRARPLRELRAGEGCLADALRLGVARFDLTALQKRAVTLALAAVRGGVAPWQSEPEKIDWQLSRLNCYACHDRGGKGGPEDPRAQYFASNDPGGESLGDLGHLPPSLDRVGRKLTRGWFERVLWGDGGAVRPYLSARMPSFGRANTEPLIAWMETVDKPAQLVKIDTSGLLKHQRAEFGRKLLGATGLACIACHGLKDRKSLGVPVIRLTHTVERLRPEYFKELLLNPQATMPGTLMPPMFVGRRKADQEIEQIWTYLKELDQQPLPEGLLQAGEYELKPETEGRPIVFRTFLEGAGTHAIAIGYPQGVHVAFDARSCQWAVMWKGRFLDALSTWQDRFMAPAKPLGGDVKAIAPDPDPGERVFLGYRLGGDGVPTFLYRSNGKDVAETMRPSGDGRGFERIILEGRSERRVTISW